MDALPPTHPVADIWPLMSDAELDKLAADIKERGQILPIVRVDGLILDGRNRWLACQRADIEPWIEDFETTDPDGLAWSFNEHRRHADAGVRAMAAARRERLQHGGARQGQDANLHVETRADIAEQFGVSPRTVASAKTVLEHGNPFLIGAVEGGDVAVSLAAKTVRRIEETGEQITSLADITRVMTEAWREDNPLPERPPRTTEPKLTQSHVSIDTFEVVHAIIRHAGDNPPEEAAAQIDKWTRLNILDDLPPAIAYLSDLKTALDGGGDQ